MKRRRTERGSLDGTGVSATRVVLIMIVVLLVTAVTWSLTIQGNGPTAARSHHLAAAATTPTTADPPSTTTTTTTSPSPTPLGVYAGPGDAAQAQQLALATGRAVPYALDYLDGSSWSTIADPSWLLAQWAGKGFQMILGVPMVPATGASLAGCASGAYDREYVSLGENLVAGGQGNSIVMPGWNPGIAGTAWSVTNAAQAANYVGCWRQLVESMREADGQQFRFAWDVSGGWTVVPSRLVYPGDAWTDIVATSIFDRLEVPASGSRWSTLAGSIDGPPWAAGFAAQHDKGLLVVGWGLIPAGAGGGGDDPTFVTDLLTWASNHGAIAAVAWDYGIWGLNSGTFPASLAAVRAAGATSVPPATPAG